jgi:hypothetical protein
MMKSVVYRNGTGYISREATPAEASSVLMALRDAFRP